jgi:hypothetical protein
LKFRHDALPPPTVNRLPDVDIDTVKVFLLGLQDTIVTRLAGVDGGDFQLDTWERPQGGGGITRLLEDGKVFERAGVGYSHVFGPGLPPSASAARPELAGRSLRHDPDVPGALQGELSLGHLYCFRVKGRRGGRVLSV